MNKLFALSSLILLAGCGVNSASIDSAPGDDETAESGSELTSSTARAWWPTHAGDVWTFTSKSATREFKVDYSDSQMAHLKGLERWLGYADASAPNSLYAWNEEG